MKYVGSDRTITLSYENHQTAEDYAGAMSSPLCLKGTFKVVKTVTKYKVHEDSINYNQFLSNQQNWKRNGGYQCTTITGKSLFVPSDELSGNCVIVEGYVNGQKYQVGLHHMENVYVQVGDVIQDEKVLGTQGNTGLVLSGKAMTDRTYGTHVHVEVKDANGNYINPRPFASGEMVLSLEEDAQSKEDLQEPPKNDKEKETIEGILLFTCPLDDTYFLKLQKGEKLYLVKPTS